MKTLPSILIAFLMVVLVGCIDNPYVKVTSPDGTVTMYSTGRNVLGEVDEQVSEVQGPNGIHVRHMVKRQDATRFAIAAAQAAGIVGSAYIGYLNTLAKEATAQYAAGQLTIQQRDAALAQIENAKLAYASGAYGGALKYGAVPTVGKISLP